jgi:membrane-bound lytic murein transglycosylase D
VHSNLRKPSSINRMVAAIVVTFLLGCGGTGRESAGSLGSNAAAADEDYRASLDRFSSRIETSRELHADASGGRFESNRDSLVADVNAFIRQHPHAEDDPEFVSILNALSALDTLTARGPGDRDGYSAVDDSLALASAEWPTADLPASDGRMFSTENTQFPVIESTRIDFWINYFTGPGRDRFDRALYRMQLHRPTVEPILDEMDLPQELICIAFIESGFAMKAVSSASAVGPWQFISGTGRRYGLRSNWWYEERSDIVASTYAAGNYLKDLYSIWGDWFLAFAAYNCGEYRVARQVARQKTKNFWELDLPLQTERYVPKFLAALYIMREPEKYGFTIPQVEPLRYDLITVEYAIELDVLARCAGTTTEVIKEMNPQLRRGATPPNMVVHLKVPAGAGELCMTNIAALPPTERVRWQEHTVRKGETLSGIAGRYDTSVDALRDANNLRRTSLLQIGQRLVIPVPGGSAAAVEVTSSKPSYRTRTSTIDRDALERYAERAVAGATTTGRSRTVYTVRPNDTLSGIASAHGVGVSQIRSWNNLSRRRHIYPGQKLAIYVRDSSVARTPEVAAATSSEVDEARFESQRHVVSSGETFYSISRRYNVSMNDLMAWNGKTRSIIRPGDVLVIWKPRAVEETGGR